MQPNYIPIISPLCPPSSNPQAINVSLLHHLLICWLCTFYCPIMGYSRIMMWMKFLRVWDSNPQKTSWLLCCWLVVDLPLWKIWQSVGSIIPNIWKIKNVPNHQPDHWGTVGLGRCMLLLVATSAFKSSRSGLETSWQPGLPPKVPRRLWPCYASVHNANAMAGSTDI